MNVSFSLIKTKFDLQIGIVKKTILLKSEKTIIDKTSKYESSPVRL